MQDDIDAHPPLSTQTPDTRPTAAEKVRTFPQTPGVYLMKDDKGNVIYVGKAKNLRSRAGSYFLKEAAINLRTAELVKHIRDIDFLDAESEVDALLKENRLIKDIRPRFNKDLKDGKSYPYLQIRVREEFPRVEITRTPRRRGVRLYGPFTSVKSLKAAVNVLQRVLQFRTCTLPIKSSEDRWRWFRPCLLASIRQCTAPCNLRVSRDDYRRQIKKLILILEGKKSKLLRRMERDMKAASAGLQFEKAGRIRDEMAALEKLDLRGDAKNDDQPEVFPLDPKKGLLGLRKVLGLAKTPRSIEGFDIAHLSGKETVASLVSFLDGLPFKDYYRRFKIKTVEGVDDFASMREVIFRRFKRLHDEDSVFPDIILIDGGKGQLSAAMDAFKALGIEPPTLISLAKQEEEIFRPGVSESIKLSRHSAALRLLQYVRDEAHRFAQHYHHTLRKKKMTE
ncbi:excinuclease ABC subunit UvrC [Limnoglobus roseus]|uniref:Excinuclease ABC subunit UvrC n=1 Tax=Limnoglobus roseus TaxID=2598579 RepID=A0A5C1A4B1_9BACT|nr:excinuclease ABC subunit UvrC [Limnoglobus roseus]QEL13153.1 excinuclease ABC subunit UvrC [Limnoglobus roseus]